MSTAQKSKAHLQKEKAEKNVEDKFVPSYQHWQQVGQSEHKLQPSHTQT